VASSTSPTREPLMPSREEHHVVGAIVVMSWSRRRRGEALRADEEP
jgi:hypothetical protein